MTQQPPTDYPGDVVITGQRRQADGTFPSPAGGGGGIPGDDGSIHQEEVDPDPPDWPYSPPHPCDDPETALPWNADAAGAGSGDAFVSKAAGVGDTDPQTGMPTLANREFGRGLARGPNGSVWGNAVTPGPDRDPNDPTSRMTINMDGISYWDYIGDAHSHPNGNPLPSQEDWDGFIFNNNEARLRAGRTSETFYMYITTVGPDGLPDKTYVYQDGPRASGSPDPARPAQIGPEVNPNAQPCP